MTSGSHPRHRLDEVIHSPLRLSIASALSAVDKAEFRAVRDAVEISDSLLSKQVALLEQAGYIKVSKDRVGRRPRTWLALNDTGREALAAHLAALSDITQGHALAAADSAPLSQSAAGAARTRRPPLRRSQDRPSSRR